MMDNEEFQREERYIVIKIADLKYISVENKLRSVLKDAGIKTRECVVVEADWPEYEIVWQMLKDRVEGRPNQLAAATEREKAEADAARIDWLEGALFDKCWNGVIDSGSRNYWRIHPAHRHATANMQGTTFRAAIDAARAYRSSHD